MANEWTKKHFSRRHYAVTGADLDKAQLIELIVKVDGKVLAHLQAREPGLVAFVSKPSEQGFDLEIVQPGVRYTDVRLPSGEMTEPVQDWQFAALGVTS